VRKRQSHRLLSGSLGGLVEFGELPSRSAPCSVGSIVVVG
jgi:hypothetical protein